MRESNEFTSMLSPRMVVALSKEASALAEQVRPTFPESVRLAVPTTISSTLPTIVSLVSAFTSVLHLVLWTLVFAA